MFYRSDAFKKFLGCFPERPGQGRRKKFFKRIDALKKFLASAQSWLTGWLAGMAHGWHGIGCGPCCGPYWAL